MIPEPLSDCCKSFIKTACFPVILVIHKQGYKKTAQQTKLATKLQTESYKQNVTNTCDKDNTSPSVVGAMYRVCWRFKTVISGDTKLTCSIRSSFPKIAKSHPNSVNIKGLNGLTLYHFTPKFKKKSEEHQVLSSKWNAVS